MTEPIEPRRTHRRWTAAEDAAFAAYLRNPSLGNWRRYQAAMRTAMDREPIE